MSRRFAVSTLGMPGRPLAESAALAARAGCDGLEIRTHADEEVNVDAGDRRLRSLRTVVEDAGLQVACLAGYVRVCAEAPPGNVESDLRRLIDAAQSMGAPSIRVFPGGAPGDTARGRARLHAVLPELETAGVQLLVETHDSHPTVRAARELVAPLERPEQFGVLWDAVHPWLAGESPACSRSLAGEHLAYFQIKDLALHPKDRDRPLPAVPGEGDLPLGEFARALQGWHSDAGGRDAWISLEWELAWYPEIGSVRPALEQAGRWFQALAE
ncbi:sugar phosphate isomerase/epimerase [Zhihengliuella alba]|uniref:Sugar phosphate isomerase/epimerase n=1 Tax=Zhihengliuella alba TaxID=547018 RepID=A0ABP7DEI4_9MICC